MKECWVGLGVMRLILLPVPPAIAAGVWVIALAGWLGVPTLYRFQGSFRTLLTTQETRRA